MSFPWLTRSTLDMNAIGRQAHSLFFGTLLVFAVGGPLWAADEQTPAVSRSNEFTQAMADFEAQLGDLESQFGPYHRSLLEPLQGMTELAQGAEDYAQVEELQSRQLQVMRTVLGFKNPELVPLMHSIIDTQMRLQNWEVISDHLEHIRYLTSDGEGDDPQVQLHIMEQQAYWYLTRVYLDSTDKRARNFMQARRLYEDMLDLAEETYGKKSPELIPWLYKSALSEYRLVELLNSEHGIASDAVDRLVREEGPARLQTYNRARGNLGTVFGNNQFIPIVEDGELVGEAYLRDSMHLLERIADIAEAEGDLEAQAMALIYNGDIQKVMGRGTAFRKYREAREKFLEAGIAEATVEKYFNQPMIIPVAEFFPRLNDAIAHREQNLPASDTRVEGGLHLGQFIAWEESLPNVPRPVSADALFDLELPYNQIDLTLSISSSGRLSSAEVIAAVPAERNVEREASRSVRELQVRPAIVAGKAKRTRDVAIRYFYLQED